MGFGPDDDRRLAELMRAAQAGDRAAYDRLLRDAQNALAAYLARRIRSAETIEDLVQDILLAVHGARHTFDPEKPFGPWMYGIARRRLADFWRKHLSRFRQEVQGDAALAGEAEPVERAPSDVEERVSAALGALPDHQSQVIRLLKVEGFSIREVAAQLQMSEAAVKVAAHRAYKRLRKTFLAEADGNE